MTYFIADTNWTLPLALTGRWLITVQFCLIYTYTQELYPTVMRSLGVGVACTVARVAGLLAPQIALLVSWHIFASFGVLSMARFSCFPKNISWDNT